ncbi:hypothetical protein SL103_26000 [Streptomyces lydicus]|uniref:peptide-methionine (R)-S-oxide reductase n=1 Tax=Streptomyces lydicus TaxID=47763 RepID=A0A1D7VR80_9ACTN|nr:peptide-methionine (R)-S-oxide reductase [Streptomyces lydicus]AOP49237.1 hypothetical protein SL103_26000 [Streptomyces lydicus]
MSNLVVTDLLLRWKRWGAEIRQERLPRGAGTTGRRLGTGGTLCESANRAGWLRFWEARDPNAVELVHDNSHGMVRTEVRCAKYGSHLGHVFEGEGYPTPTDQRYCINSISLRLTPEADQPR